MDGKPTRFHYGLGSVIERKTKKGGKTFGIDYKINGAPRVRKAIKGARTRADALKVLTNELSAAFQEENGFKRDVPELTFAEMEAKYMEKYSKPNKRSWKSDESYLKTLCAAFGQLPLNKIVPEMIEDYKIARLKAGLKPISINRHLDCGQTLYSKAIDWNYCSFNPFKKVDRFSEAGTEKQRILTKSEEERLLRACPDYLKNILAIGLWTGMRRGELLPLKWADVHFDKALIRVALPKEGKSKEVPINDELMAVLKSLRSKAGGNEYVFTNPTTGTCYKDPKRSFHSACTAAEIIGLRFHDLRHSFITREIQAGVQSQIIMSITGHTTEKTFRRYAHPQQEDRLRAVQLLCKNPAKNPDENEPPCQTCVERGSNGPVTVPATKTESVS